MARLGANESLGVDMTTNTQEIECSTCEGTGESFKMVCYGGMPFERVCDCPDCDGKGAIEVLVKSETIENIMDITRGMFK